MKIVRLIFLTSLIFLIVAPSWANATTSTEKLPVISVEETTFTFPEVLDGAKIVHDFIVKNKGTAVLKIDHVDTT